jgi:NADPH:quinone reductase-like Zn-dependent oxidoreductase
MKAIIINRHSDWKTLQLEETEMPILKPNQVLVKIKASGVNALDWKAPEYNLFDRLNMKLPYIVGNEVSGVIEQVGEGVKRFEKGDEIFGALDLVTEGGFAEYVAIDQNAIAHKPKNLSFVEAAAVPVGSLTAWQALYDKLNIQPGEKILIQAAAGGVGIFGVQLARLSGAYVVAIASAKNRDFLKSLGADEVFDYTNDYSLLPGNFDAVMDSMDTAQQMIPLIKKGGRYVSLTEPAPDELSKKFDVSVASFLYRPDAVQLDKIKELIETNKLSVVVDKIFPLSGANEALKYQSTSHTRGKNILNVGLN